MRYLQVGSKRSGGGSDVQETWRRKYTPTSRFIRPVSTDDQRERQTIQGQVDALVGAAPHLGLEIVDHYLDDGVSGTLPMEKRPEGARLIEDARAKKFDVVFFYKLDRLARSLRKFLDIVDFFEEAGIGLKSMTESFDTPYPMAYISLTGFSSQRRQ